MPKSMSENVITSKIQDKHDTAKRDRGYGKVTDLANDRY